MKLAESIRKEYYLIGAVLSFIGAMIGGILSYTHLWLFFGILGFICVFMGYPNAWTYMFWLAGIYIFAGLGGALFMLQGPLYIVIGVICEVVALYIVLSLLQNVINTRDNHKRELPLGLWSMSVLIFFVCANISLSDWARWVMGRSDLAPYVVAESLLIMLLGYILWVPENKLGKGATFPAKCPSCGGILKDVHRTCPECAHQQSFHWCKQAEHYVVPCTHCGELTAYGDSCVHCVTAQPKGVKCESCNAENPLKAWVLV